MLNFWNKIQLNEAVIVMPFYDNFLKTIIKTKPLTEGLS